MPLSGAGLRGQVQVSARANARELFISPVKCDHNVCGVPTSVPEDNNGEKIAKFALEAALSAASTEQSLAIGIAGFKLFTQIYNNEITKGDVAYDPLAGLKKEILDFVAAGNEVQDITNQANDIAVQLQYVASDLADYQEYKDTEKLADARKVCNRLHDLHTPAGQPGVNGVSWLRSRLPNAASYCSLCTYVWTISRAALPNSVAIADKAERHLEDCAETLPGFVQGAIEERMNHVPVTLGQLKEKNNNQGFVTHGSNVCHLSDWSGYWSYMATDPVGNKPIVNWEKRGICTTPLAVIPEGLREIAFVMSTTTLAVGQQVECPALDGLPGTIGHEADRCIQKYRLQLRKNLGQQYVPFLNTVPNWLHALESLRAARGNSLQVNHIRNDGGHLFGKGFQQYDELAIRKYGLGFDDAQTVCHSKCVQDKQCTGFSYRVDDRFDGRTNGNCWFFTGELKEASGSPSSNPIYAGSWVKAPEPEDVQTLSTLKSQWRWWLFEFGMKQAVIEETLYKTA
jgi:hypothetical protein